MEENKEGNNANVFTIVHYSDLFASLKTEKEYFQQINSCIKDEQKHTLLITGIKITVFTALLRRDACSFTITF